MHSNKIAVVGNKDIILAFKAIGMDVFSADTPADGEAIIKDIAKEYAVIFLTEDIARGMEETLAKYKSKPYPAIIPIPSHEGSTGFGIAGIKKDVEKAVGTDILFDKED